MKKKRKASLQTSLTSNAKLVLERRYLLRNEKGEVTESPEKLFERVSRAVSENEWRDRPKWADTFYEVMASRRFMPNSPTLMNAGKKGGQLSACFVLPIEDSLESIFDTLKFAAKIHQSGGGTGFSFSKVRPRGSIVRSTHGVASGPVSFMHIFDVATETIKQGGTRRGANMAILRVDHPDIFEFINVKLDQKSVTNFNISIGATEEFMCAVKDGADFFLKDALGKRTRSVKARELFEKIAQSAWTCGDPGMVFLDRINFFNPTPKVGDMESTNPCVVGGTRIYVEGRGLIPIEDLVGNNPWIASENKAKAQSGFFQAKQVLCTGVKPVFRLSTLEGYEIELTEDHPVATERGDVLAGDLQRGDRIRLMEAVPPSVNQDNDDARAGEVIGWLVGDGHFTHHGEGKRVLSFYGGDKGEAAPSFKLRSSLDL